MPLGGAIKHVPAIDRGVCLMSKVVACCALLAMTVFSTLLIEASKQPDGSYAYNTFAIPCTVEMVKFVVSCAALFLGRSNIDSYKVVRCRHNICLSPKYAIPALCYFISNNCSFYIIRALGPATFQITNSLKILSTGVLMQVLLGRKLSWLQWKSLMLLVIGTLVSRASADLHGIAQNTHAKSVGYILVLFNALVAGLGGVMSEKLLKTTDPTLEDSIHSKNAQLYFFGVVFGLFKLQFLSDIQISHPQKMFHGFNSFAYAIVVTQAAGGLTVSFILKYIDNIANCFVSAVSMLCVAFVHAHVENKTVSMDIILGILLIFMAIEQYHGNVLRATNSKPLS